MFQMTIRSFSTTVGALLALGVALAGCSSRTDVSGTGGTPTQFTHVYITTQEIAFNTSATAGPDDAGWNKFTLTNPVTIDLVTESNGTLGEIANDLKVAPGTYNAILLVPYINATTATSATALGATYNQEADYTDASGSHTVSLVIPNPEKGIVVPGTGLTVPIGGGGLPVGGSTSSTTAGTTNAASTLANQPTTVNPTTSTTSTTSTTNNTVTVSFGASWDLNRDLHIFALPFAASASSSSSSSSSSNSSATGVLLSAGSGVSSDLSTTGGISGTLTLTSLTNITGPSGRVAIQACAETLDSTGGHYQVVLCAPVQTDGTFTIYPLQSNSKTATNYEVVIHGPNIETIIIHTVPATTSTPSLATATTSGSVAATTDGTPVSLGTFIPTATGAYSVSASASTSGGLPAGAAVTFYETVNKIPYAIDEVGIDPINLNLQTNECLSAGAVQTGTYSSSGSTITVTSENPGEGLGNYVAAAVAPLYTDGIGSGSAAVKAPTSGITSTTTCPASASTTVTIPGLTLGSGSISASITATAAKYSGGQLLVGHNGAVIGAAAISNTILVNGSGTVTVSGLPASGDYYLSAMLWNAGELSFTYESLSTTPLTVSSGAATSTSAAIN